MLQKVFEEYEIVVPTEKVHPVYKDLEPFFEYKLEDVILVYTNALELISLLIVKLREKEQMVQKYLSKSQSGIRIANFINTLEYENNVMTDKISLYISYCEFFQSSQLKYFTKLYTKIKLLQDEINEEIVFHETPWDNTTIHENVTLQQVVEERPVMQWEEEEELVGVSKEDLDVSEWKQQQPPKKNNKHKKR
jgi:hypothetical protein